MRRMKYHQQAEDSIDHKFIWDSRWVGWCISQSGLDTTNASGAALRMHRDFCSDAHASKDTNEKCKNTKIQKKALRNQALTTLTKSTIGKIKQSLSHHTNQTHIAVIVNGEILVKLQLGLVWQRAKIYVTTDKSMYQLGEISAQLHLCFI